MSLLNALLTQFARFSGRNQNADDLLNIVEYDPYFLDESDDATLVGGFDPVYYPDLDMYIAVSEDGTLLLDAWVDYVDGVKVVHGCEAQDGLEDDIFTWLFDYYWENFAIYMDFNAFPYDLVQDFFFQVDDIIVEVTGMTFSDATWKAREYAYAMRQHAIEILKW